MSDRLPVCVFATDPVSEAGVASQLRVRPELRLVGGDDVAAAAVAVVVVEDVDADAVRVIRVAQRSGCPRTVVVASRLDDAGVVAAAGAGACGLLRRSEAGPERLVAAVLAAASGAGTVPGDLVGRLLRQVGDLQRQVLQPRGLTWSGLTQREVDVLRLVADGCDTSEIAGSLCYSERTVKNVIHDITTRLQLRNRSHAVAYALREGLI